MPGDGALSGILALSAAGHPDKIVSRLAGLTGRPPELTGTQCWAGARLRLRDFIYRNSI